MKSSKFLIIPILAGVKVALATGSHHHDPKPSDPPNTPIVVTAAAANSSESESRADADASAASSSDASSASTSTSNSNSGGNSQTTNSIYRGVRNAPGVYTGAVAPTAPCQGGWSVGGSTPAGGLSFGKSRTIKDCVLAELSSAELARGNLQASIQLRCRISYYREALGNDCEALLNTQTSNAVPSAREVRYADPAKRAADRAKLLQEVSK